jgi:ParB/RepB/Spo0J family partition protein
MQIIKVKTGELQCHPANDTIYSNHPDRIAGLVKNIADKGILTPLLVMLINSIYYILSGNSRFMAGQQLGLEEYPVIVVDIAEDEVEYFIVSANRQRDKFPSEEFKEMLVLKSHYAKKSGERTDLNDEEGHNTRKLLAEYFDMSEGQVQKYETIGRVKSDLFKMIDSEEISINQAYNLCKKGPDAEPQTLHEMIVAPKPCCSECGRPLTKAQIEQRKKEKSSDHDNA